MNETEKELQEFLKPTRSCDFDNSFIRNKTLAIIGDSKSDREKALAIFYWVRDNIKFSLSDVDASATQTLKNGYGECANKTSLHMALLRSIGIPARMHVSLAKREPLQPIIPKFVYNKISDNASHFWPECYIDDKWISCEALLDKPLYDALIKANKITTEQIPTIDWNGKEDLIVLKYWIVEEKGYVNSYDEVYQELIKNRKQEGLPPAIITKLFGGFINKTLFKYSEKVRRGQK